MQLREVRTSAVSPLPRSYWSARELHRTSDLGPFITSGILTVVPNAHREGGNSSANIVTVLGEQTLKPVAKELVVVG